MASELLSSTAGDARGHEHDWPITGLEWQAVAECRECGLAMLRLFVGSADWVVRRVEHIRFRDERTVRRAVSVDYASPPDAVSFHHRGNGSVRVLPFALMRRKSLVNFDLRGDDGRPLPLLGLRENQALTLAIGRAWAARSLRDPDELPPAVDKFIGDVVTGDQREMAEAFERLAAAPAGDELARLREDHVFMAVVDRLATDFLLYSLDRGPAGTRHILKFSYDEPLALQYRRPGFMPREPDGADDRPSVYRQGELLPRTDPIRWKSALGLEPTLIRFPVPGAELATSYHIEIDAPPDVDIVEAQLLAGRPHPEVLPEPAADRSTPAGWQPRRRPSFDRIGGGYPTVDLHVAEVPYGALARAQVALQASPKGWLPTATLACWISTAVLAIAAWRQPNTTDDVASGLLVGFAAATLAMLIRPDPHRMVTRLLSGLRNLALASALLSFAGAAVFTFFDGRGVQAILTGIAIVSLVPTGMLTWAWMTARFRRRPEEESPWEQHKPAPDAAEPFWQRPYLDDLVDALERAERPYDVGLEMLGFLRPAIRIASSEAWRTEYRWTSDFVMRFAARLGGEPEPPDNPAAM